VFDLTINLKCHQDRLESLKALKSRFRREAVARIEEHFEELRDDAKTVDYVEQEEIQQEWFDWSVQFQVLGHDVPEIAGTTVDERTVRKGVERVLSLIGLSRRAVRPGPKRKSRNY
jgi:hypothetical protein